jgi:hypothetical protein
MMTDFKSIEVDMGHRTQTSGYFPFPVSLFLSSGWFYLSFYLFVLTTCCFSFGNCKIERFSY